MPAVASPILPYPADSSKGDRDRKVSAETPAGARPNRLPVRPRTAPSRHRSVGFGQESLQQLLGLTCRVESSQAFDDLRSLERVAGRRRRALVEHEPPDVRRQRCLTQSAAAAERMAEDVDRIPGLGREAIDDSGDI